MVGATGRRSEADEMLVHAVRQTGPGERAVFTSSCVFTSDVIYRLALDVGLDRTLYGWGVWLFSMGSWILLGTAL